MEESSLILQDHFHGVDFHVHTPASHCYKGDKSDTEYLEILKRYSEKNIKIIAITDHNTVKGYKTLIKIKAELQAKQAVLNEYISKHPDLQSELEEINTNLLLFDEMLILPGVELEAKPGIHLLLIFDPKTEIAKIEHYIEFAGYPEDTQGKENPGIVSKVDVLDVLEQSREFSFIVIAAHADSDKGIYNDLDRLYRANVFKSSNLIAVSFNNPKNVQKMKSMLQNKEYQREVPLAFIQSSDNHGQIEPGTNISYLKLSSINFESVVESLKNPNECVSATERPEVINILTEIVHDSKTITHPALDNESDEISLLKSMCAIVNDGYGTIVIGVIKSPEISIIGLTKDREEIFESLKNISNKLQPKGFTREYSVYPFGINRIVVSMKITRRIDRVFYLKDTNECFLLKDSKVYDAKVNDIEDLVEHRMITRMSEFQRKTTPKINEIITQVGALADRAEYFEIVFNVEKEAYSFSYIYNINVIPPFKGEFSVALSNGSADGDVIFIERFNPRLTDAYLRCTAPRTNSVNADMYDIEKFKAPSILISPGGGSFLLENPNDSELAIINLEKWAPLLQLTLKTSFESRFSHYSIVGWLKSSINLWYCNIVLDDINIHKPDVLKNIKIPRLNSLRPEGEVESLVHEIIETEKRFLSSTVEEMTKEELASITISHNAEINRIAFEIDRILFNELNISPAQIEHISKTLSSINVFTITE